MMATPYRAYKISGADFMAFSSLMSQKLSAVALFDLTDTQVQLTPKSQASNPV
jgi:hypothetical protein